MEAMVSVRVLLGPLAYARTREIAVEPLLAEIGLDPSRLADLDAFVPLLVTQKLFARLQAETGERLVGLRASELVGPAAFDVFRYTGASSSSLGSALEGFVRWFPM